MGRVHEPERSEGDSANVVFLSTCSTDFIVVAA